MDRVDPRLAGDERTLLAEFLDYQRATLVHKVSGLTRAQLHHRVGASELTLAGLVKHLALVEDSWFQEDLLGAPLPEPWASAPFDDDRDWDFHSAVDDEPEDLLALYDAACDRSRRTCAEAESLEVRSVATDRTGERYTLRWIMLHLLEETARHNGHADLLREAIDGATGE